MRPGSRGIRRAFDPRRAPRRCVAPASGRGRRRRACSSPTAHIDRAASARLVVGRRDRPRPGRRSSRSSPGWRIAARQRRRRRAPVASPARGGRPQPLPSWSPSARPPASVLGAVAVVAAARRGRGRRRGGRASSGCGRRCGSPTARATWPRAAQAVIDEVDELTELVVAEQGRPRAEAEVMELLPAIETLQWLAEHGPGILGRRADPLLAHAAPGQARALELRAAGRRRRARPGGRAVRHAAGRRRGRADGRQRRRAQALAARCRWAASGSRASSPAPGCPRGCCASSTATPTPAPRSSTRPWPRCASPARRAPGARSARRARAALKRAVLELGGKDAMLVLADADVAARGPRRGVGGVRQRRPVRRQRRARDRACARSTTASSPAVVRGGAAAARRRPGAIRRRRSARSSPASGAERVRALVDEAVAAGATLHCGGARRGRPLRAGRAHRRRRRRCGSRARRCPARSLVVEAVGTEERGDRARQRGRRSGSARRCGRPTATRARASPASCGSGWCG